MTCGENKKGGMDNEEFKKFVMKSIVPFYPHARNRPGKRVMLKVKVDSSPRRMNLNILDKLRHL